MSTTNPNFDDLAKSIIDGDSDLAKRIIKNLLKSRTDPLEIVENGLTRGIKVVGEKYGCGDIFLTDLLMSADAMKVGMDVISPEIIKQKKKLKKMGSLVIGTVEGDIHDLGKNIVIALFSANGFDVVDLGVDVSVKEFIDKVKELRPDILGLSALMTATIPRQYDVINELISNGIRDQVKVIIGGAAVNQNFANEIGADGYAENAIDAIELAKKLIG
jgi:corrinoid protein of di/trimethylamine methyltransferase